MILGSTGSIGTQAIDVVLRNPDRFRVTGLSAAGGRVGLLAEQAHRLRVRTVAVAREDDVPDAARGAARRSTARGSRSPRSWPGRDAATELAASDCHTVLNGITGSIGLAPTLAALEAGRTLALANKESLIVGGPLVQGAGQAGPDRPGRLRALRALPGARGRHPRRGAQAASSPPPAAPSAAVRRPSWPTSPPRRRSRTPPGTWARSSPINSATLVNKGLEVIEAHLLYDMPFDRIEVVVHPQSYVHSMVEFTDGSTLAQASPPDMRLPIALGLGWPHRVPGRRARPSTGPGRRPGSSSRWTPRPSRPCRSPATWARSGGTAPAVFNAANEECVDAFLAGRLPFTGIVDTVAAVVEEHGTPAWEPR